MTDREKLITLIQSAVDGCATHWAGSIADHLIANGVTVQTPGKWIHPVPGDGAPRCSNCKKPPVFDTGYWRYHETDFCPNCGAKMEV